MERATGFSDTAVVTLANAVLLSSYNAAISYRSDPREQGRVRHWEGVELAKDLHEALDLAGAFDPLLDGIFGQTGTVKSGDYRDRVKAAVNSDDPVARIRLWDVSLPGAVEEEYGLSEHISGASQYELRTPIAQTGFTEAKRALCRFCTDYFMQTVARGLGLGPQEAWFIGHDGIKVRAEMRRPPDWGRWNSASGRAIREQEGWAEDLTRKAETLIWLPVSRAFMVDEHATEVQRAAVDLERDMQAAGPNEDGMVDGLSGLSVRLCFDSSEVPELSEGLFDSEYPDYGAASRRDYRCDADPKNLLFVLADQIAWRAACEGMALCFAEFGAVSGHRSFRWVPAEDLPRISNDGALAPPGELGLSVLSDFEDRMKEALGADRLWFRVTNDLLSNPHMAPRPARSGPRSGQDIYDEGKARAALKAVESTVSRKPLKAEAIAVLAKYLRSSKAAVRAWDQAELNDWSKAGRIPEGGQLSEEEFEAAFLAEIGNQSPPVS